MGRAPPCWCYPHQTHLAALKRGDLSRAMIPRLWGLALRGTMRCWCTARPGRRRNGESRTLTPLLWQRSQLEASTPMETEVNASWAVIIQLMTLCGKGRNTLALLTLGSNHVCDRARVRLLCGRHKAQPWVPPTSKTLKPGESVVLGVRFLLAHGPKQVSLHCPAYSQQLYSSSRCSPIQFCPSQTPLDWHYRSPPRLQHALHMTARS